MHSAITIKNLTKHYKKVQALNNVSLDIQPGKITGLVGPNGAGKSTLIKSLVGALQPTAGDVKVLDLDPIKQRWSLRKKLGYMPQEPALYTDLSARENVAFYARLHRVADSRQHAAKLLSELDLGGRLNSPVNDLSGGMQKRVSLACALVHNPQLLILDEPTAALDPILKRLLWNKFREFTSQGKTLIISTHLMDEAMLCDSVVLLQLGQVVAYGAPRELVTSGQAVLRYHKQGQEYTENIRSEGNALAAVLHKHGLSQDISQLEIEAENLEDVMVKILNKQDKKNQ
ncbi:ABC transporter ATP-binding protein [Patescibacteria group bacterium]|nr:ABC transporter ATP-binding protein [Patescibacteria group bacterium]